jgi:hypothetical protein
MSLEHDLRALADAFPDPPALAPRVRVAAQRATASRRRRRRIGLLALALLLLVPATALAVSGDLRDRVLETFGLRDVKITSVTRLPEVGPEARRLQLGSRISLARARRDLKLALRAPSALGPPDGLFEERLQSGVDITFLYEPRTVATRLGVRKRVIVSVLRGTTEKTILGKTIAAATKTIPLEIEGGAALLLTGHPHLLVMFRPPGGGVDQTYTRLVGTTLLWQRGPLLIRIEGSLPQARLVAIARSIGFG